MSLFSFLKEQDRGGGMTITIQGFLFALAERRKEKKEGDEKKSEVLIRDSICL